MNCKNCNSAMYANYCPECGNAKNLSRIDGKYIIHEIEHIIHFERGILYTVKELFLRPGKSIRNYLLENRSRLVKPVLFIIVTSLIYTLISRYFHIEDEYVNYGGLEKSAIGNILKWIQNNYGYSSIITGAFIAVWLKIFFKKYNYNFYELLIMLCFAQGISMLIFALFAIVEGFFHFKLLSVAGVIGFAYLTYAIGSFFQEKNMRNYVKALIALLLGTITFYIVIFSIGLMIDFT